jgi:hypothetical protein
MIFIVNILKRDSVMVAQQSHDLFVWVQILISLDLTNNIKSLVLWFFYIALKLESIEFSK